MAAYLFLLYNGKQRTSDAPKSSNLKKTVMHSNFPQVSSNCTANTACDNHVFNGNVNNVAGIQTIVTSQSVHQLGPISLMNEVNNEMSYNETHKCDDRIHVTAESTSVTRGSNNNMYSEPYHSSETMEVDLPNVVTQINENKDNIKQDCIKTPASTRSRIRKQLTGIDIQDIVEPISISFRKMCYDVKVSTHNANNDSSTTTDTVCALDNHQKRVKSMVTRKQEKRRILDDINGDIAAGTLLALMGPSGAGKTTLLNVLAQRSSGGEVAEGECILYNGAPISNGVKSRFGFVFQEDLLLGRLTVRETITIAAELKFSPSIPRSRKTERINNVIQTLRLESVADNRVGDEGTRGVSGGERKRTALATELVTGPSILFLDEPTTGLDSNTSLEVVRILADLCLTNMTVICSIHQPRSQIFQIFDQLMLLHRGKTAYFGPVSRIVQHIQIVALPGCHIPRHTNVADWVLDLLKDSTNGSQIIAKWQQLQKQQQQQQEQYGVSDNVNEGNTRQRELKPRRRPNCCQQFKVLVKRAHLQQRGQLFDFVSGFSSICMAGIGGLIWWQCENIDSITGVLFFVLINQVQDCFSATLTIVKLCIVFALVQYV